TARCRFPPVPARASQSVRPRWSFAACARTAAREPSRADRPAIPPTTARSLLVPDRNSSKTHENLKEAFAGESQANRRYLYFAQKADVEGYPDVAALFRSV